MASPSGFRTDASVTVRLITPASGTSWGVSTGVTSGGLTTRTWIMADNPDAEPRLDRVGYRIPGAAVSSTPRSRRVFAFSGIALSCHSHTWPTEKEESRRESAPARHPDST